MSEPSVSEWLAADPDPATRAELEELQQVDPNEVTRRFAAPLTFGTAGLRGPMGAGPSHMNRVVVRRTAAAIARTLDGGPVLIGFDARHQSERFALDSARVLAGAGIPVVLLPFPVATPVVAFGIRHLGASAGIVVTASHNPAADNGYKVYWHDGAQINSPIDIAIANEIEQGDLVLDEALAAVDDPFITADEETAQALVEAYLAYAVSTVDPNRARAIRCVYTPMHGVGCGLVDRAFRRSGFPALAVVDEQAQPDPDFPTVAFPNPEEDGALDLAIALAQATDADLLLANDPDADRLAVAVPADTSSGWTQLTGNEIGWLLADYLLAKIDRSQTSDPLAVTTVVSSSMLSKIASHYGARSERTLTGFKWIVRPSIAHPTWTPVIAYEEALGYAIGPARDKDGITAALVFAELAAETLASGRTINDRLHNLYRRFGIHQTGQRSIRWSADAPSGAMRAALQTLRDNPIERIGTRPVTATIDYLDATDLPATDLLQYNLPDGRLMIRPSGTEPKLKLYAELTAEPQPNASTDELQHGTTELQEQLDALLTDAVAAVTTR